MFSVERVEYKDIGVIPESMVLTTAGKIDEENGSSYVLRGTFSASPGSPSRGTPSGSAGAEGWGFLLA